MLSSQYKKKLDDLLYQCRKNLKPSKFDEKLISKSFKYSLEAHKNDKRASGEPFFIHPYEVAIILATEIPLDSISIASAFLHDVVEDTLYTIKDVREEFGEEIAEIVDGATKIEGIFENYETKQVESYKKMLLSMTSDIRVILIKFADRLHNLRTLEFLSNPKQIRMAHETLEIYAPLAHRFGLFNLKAELEDLSFKALDRKTYNEIATKISEKKNEREKFIKRFISPITERLSKEGFKFDIQGRAKHIYSIYKKIKTRKKEFDEIYDLFALRIILETENKNDCFSAYGICSEIYIPVPERFKDYISLPKQNGYQSIHTTLISKEGKMVEVQLRTRGMHEVAEKGIAAHWKYKENVNIKDDKLEDWMRKVRETFENASKEDTSRELMENFKLNLYQDEIYCFSPKGDLKILPAEATALDFAFEIHTQIGMKCIGAKVNGKIVNIDTKLKSGDQIEIITSKSQTPKRDWEKFVVTQKARTDIRRFLNSEKRRISIQGKEIWERKTKKNKVSINEDELQKYLSRLKYKNLNQFYFEIGQDENKAGEFLEIITDKTKLTQFEQRNNKLREDINGIEKNENEELKRFIEQARSNKSGITLGSSNGSSNGIMFTYAKCCNPIPGDDIIGFITKIEGIKIHRKTCKNIVNLFLQDPNRLVEVHWNETDKEDFTAAVKIIGEDRTGLLNDLTNTISKTYKTNIKSVNIFTKGSMFEGTLILSIQDLKQLNLIIDKIQSQEGIFSASRFE